ncbi:MAG: hypothetical protein ACLQE9_18665, partial [Roseiarcus sp.]
MWLPTRQFTMSWLASIRRPTRVSEHRHWIEPYPKLAVSLLNRLTPYVSIYFIAAPFVICGGLFLTYLVIRSYLDQFMLGLSSWLATG